MADNQPVITTNKHGDTFWYLNGVSHRTDGPAVEWGDGEKWWRANGLLHRTDGPAMEWPNGDKEWYLDGQEFTVDEWLDQNTDMSDEEKVMYKLEHG
jgi:hypothetical protein